MTGNGCRKSGISFLRTYFPETCPEPLLRRASIVGNMGYVNGFFKEWLVGGTGLEPVTSGL